MLQNVIDVDTAMTDLKKVSDGTVQDYANYLDSAADRAKNLGASITDVIGATSEFSRLGYNLEDASNLGDWATKYMNVSEYTNIEDAAQSLVSTLQGFHLSADEVGSVVDRFNEVGNNYAISSQGLGEALKRSAAALAAGGNSLDESLGLITAANEVVQDPDTVGTWAKTLTMYLRAAKEDAAAAGLETDEILSSVSEVQDKILTLTGGQVNILEDDGMTLKSTTEIMREVSGVYDSLSDLNKAALLKTLSGKRLANTTAALISNWQTVEDVINSTQNAAGSADKENEKFLDSIQGKIQQFQAEFQKTSVDLLSSDFVKGAVDAGSGLLSLLDNLIEKFGVLPGVITPVLSLLASSQNINVFGTKLKDDGTVGFTTFVDRIKNNRENAKKTSDYSLRVLRKYLDGNETLTGSAFEDVFQGASEHIKAQARDIDVSNLSAKETEEIFNKIQAAEEKATSSGARFVTTLKNIGAAVGSMIALEAAMILVTAAIKGIAEAWDKAHMSGKEAIEVSDNSLQQYASSMQSIEKNLSSVEALEDRFNELSQGVSENGKNISLTSDEYQEYLNIVDQLTAVNPKLIQGYNDENNAIINKNTAIQQTIDLLKQQRTEEAKNAVYGGTNDNDEHMTNGQAAYVAWKEEYRTAKSGVKQIDNSAADLFTKIYDEAKSKGKQQAGRVMSILQNAIGQTYDDFVKEGEKKGSLNLKGRFSSDGWRNQYFAENADSIKSNLNDILTQLDMAGLLSDKLAQEGSSVANSWDTADQSIDATSSRIADTAQAVYESYSEYYDMSDAQKNFLNQAAQGIDLEKFNQLGDNNAIVSFSRAMMNITKDSINGKRAVEDFYKLAENQNSLPISEYLDQAHAAIFSFKNDLKSYLNDDEINAIDFEKMFGVSTVKQQAEDFKNTIQDNLSSVLDSKSVYSQEYLNEFRNYYNDYAKIVNEMKEKGVEANKTQYGNIDLNNRGVLEWTTQNLEKYKDALASWGQSADELKGQISTVLGGAETFGDLDIAFSPML